MFCTYGKVTGNISVKSYPEKEMFYQLEEFDLFGVSGELKWPKILGNDIFVLGIASRTLPSKNFQPNHFLIRNC